MVTFDRMARAVAGRLHDDTITVYTPAKTTGKYGSPIPGEPELLGEIQCDVQPYSAELAQKDYGLVVQAEKRVFTLPTPWAVLGNLAQIGGAWYRIEAMPDDRSMCVMLLTRR